MKSHQVNASVRLRFAAVTTFAALVCASSGFAQTAQELTLTPDASCYTVSEGTVYVDIVFTQTGDDEILGGQFFLSYDTTRLEYVGIQTGEPPFTQQIYVGHDSTAGTIDYAVGVPLGEEPGYSGPGPITMVRITFEAQATACDEGALVAFRETGQVFETQLSRRVGLVGSEVFTPEGLNDLASITLDWTPPTITCPQDITRVADSGVCHATATDLGTPDIADNCGVVAVSDNRPVNNQYPVGTTLVTWTVVDGCGNSATCTQTVTVVDDQGPTIACPDNITAAVDPDACHATLASLGTPATSDNCGVATVTHDGPPEGHYPVGTTTVTWTVTDIHGNSETCTQLVTVVDDQDPTIVCPADIQQTTEDGACYASIAALGTPDTDDNCAVATVTNDAPAGGQFPLGATTVTWTVTDVHGNTNTCTQSVTVIDDQDPVIDDCPADIEITGDAATCSAVVTWIPPTGHDNCGEDVVSTSTHSPGDSFPAGTTTVVYTFTDAAGNTSTCDFDVTVEIEFVVNVEVQGIDRPLTRCIAFTFVNCTTAETVTLDREIAFDALGVGSAIFTDLPCDEYTCVTAEDHLHTLRVRLDGAELEIVDGQFVADFTGANRLQTADYYDDNRIDIADFGVFIAQWGACYDSDGDLECDGHTPCDFVVDSYHVDANGDGIPDVTDLNAIICNFLHLGDRPCCSTARDGAPREAVTVKELRRMGVRRAGRADLDHDGWITLEDVELFLSGDVPEDPPLPATVRQSPEPRR